MKTYKEIWQALTDGKKITHKEWKTAEYIQVDADGALRDEEGIAVETTFMADWPLSGYSIVVEPEVVHPGTFAWAMLQVQKGNTVACEDDLDCYEFSKEDLSCMEDMQDCISSTKWYVK